LHGTVDGSLSAKPVIVHLGRSPYEEGLNVELTLSDELTAVADLARAIGLEKLSPAARAAESARRVEDDVWMAMVQTGLTVLTATTDDGDGMVDAVTHVIAAENFAYGDPGIAAGALWSGATAMLLSQHGTPEQADQASRQWSDPAARGALAMYEPYGRGPDEWTTAVSSHDGSVTVRGSKVAVPFAHEAETLIVVGNDPGTGLLHAVLVPRDSKGVTLHPVYGSVGLDAAPMSAVDFDLTMPAGSLLGGGSLDPIALAVCIERVRLLLGAVAIGVAQRAIDYASAYATDRVAFGRPIAGFQGVSFLLADKQIRVEAARLQVAFAATEVDAGASDLPALGRIRLAVRDAVNYAADVAAMTTRDAVQVLGGHGFIVDHPVELWYRAAAALAALDFDPLCSSFEPVL
jgi:alkylation response protein AidB-like acyl-CoA dehydrogenase